MRGTILPFALRVTHLKTPFQCRFVLHSEIPCYQVSFIELIWRRNPRVSVKVVWTETHLTFRQLPCHFPITSCELPICDENIGFLPIGHVLSAHDILIWNSIWLVFFNILHTNLGCKVVVIKRGMNVLMSYYWQWSTVLERVSHKSNRRTQSASCNGSLDSVICTEKRVKHFLVF